MISEVLRQPVTGGSGASIYHAAGSATSPIRDLADVVVYELKLL